MKPGDVVSIVIAGMSLLFLMFATMFGLIIRITRKWTVIEGNLAHLTDSFAQLVKDKGEAHAEIAAQMRGDRQANNARLTWLERNLWQARTGQQHGPGM